MYIIPLRPVPEQQENRAHPHSARSAALRPANERKELNGCLSSEVLILGE